MLHPEQSFHSPEMQQLHAWHIVHSKEEPHVRSSIFALSGEPSSAEYIVTKSDTLLAEMQVPIFMHLIGVDVKRSNQAALRTELKAQIEAHGYEYQQLLSAALSPRNHMTVVYKIPGAEYVVVTTRTDELSAYHMYLACLMTAFNTDADFVRRATTAIASNTRLQFTTEEALQIEQYSRTKSLKDSVDLLITLFQGVDNQHRIDSLQSDIDYKVNELHQMLQKLKNEQIKQFYRKNGLGANTALLEELQDYMKTSTNIMGIVKRPRATSNEEMGLLVVSKAYLRIPTDDKDFFKPEARKNPNHLLYNRPYVAELLEDVMNNKLRVPIYAAYLLYLGKDSTFIIKRASVEQLPSHLQSYCTSGLYGMNNRHVNQFDCFSGYKNQMQDAYYRQDIVGLLEIMTQCTASISVFDTTVMQHMIREIENMSQDVPVKYYEDGKWNDISLGGYYEKIKARPE
jgi:hypothetical protein